ncbi:MAG: hypothetical protein ABL997_17020, partial [Planctomycetota bacterium]
GETPFDLLEVTATSDGFSLTFTAPVDPSSVVASAIAVKSFTYDHHESYGCPPRDVRPHTVTEVAVVEGSPAVVHVSVDDLGDCRVYALDASAVKALDGTPLWHGKAWYTRNQAP